MSSVREKDVGLRTGNLGRFASPTHGEGADLRHGRASSILNSRYGFTAAEVERLRSLVDSGKDLEHIAGSLGVPEPVAQDASEVLRGNQQITADDGVSELLLDRLGQLGVNSCHVERMKRGKTLIKVGGAKIPVALTGDDQVQFEVGSEVFETAGVDDYYAWVGALHSAIDREAIIRNVDPLIAQGEVDFEVSPYDGTASGSWKLGGAAVRFTITSGSRVVFDPSMKAEDGVRLQGDLGVRSLQEVAPSISRFRVALSRAHRWSLWNPAMDTHRHQARPGIRDGFEYRRQRAALVGTLGAIRAEYTESEHGVILHTQGPGYVAEALVGAAGTPAFYVNDHQVHGLDESKTNQRELAKFLVTHLEALQQLEIARRNGLAARQLPSG